MVAESTSQPCLFSDLAMLPENKRTIAKELRGKLPIEKNSIAILWISKSNIYLFTNIYILLIK
jgi:hypothetical protein